ncbi:hypothetical protein AXG93_3310s1100 [Marchantia polymorpha subsp. ruderalis]|uniref:Uncharacterized protein n=1 Tax=Marchantia polymorpha subsp. ruderalis TaxID=1480154 RepID=A0A176W2B9_MARPO|nr:hypothetical protein AXG93_3310s1100 [Marchantia polymorpha subsp. ruderalis]
MNVACGHKRSTSKLSRTCTGDLRLHVYQFQTDRDNASNQMRKIGAFPFEKADFIAACGQGWKHRDDRFPIFCSPRSEGSAHLDVDNLRTTRGVPNPSSVSDDAKDRTQSMEEVKQKQGQLREEAKTLERQGFRQEMRRNAEAMEVG